MAKKSVFLMSIVAFMVAALSSAEPSDAFETQRQLLLDKPRMVIYDNDGNDSYLFPRNKPFSIEAFLALRTAGLEKSAVCAVAYCTLASGFGQFTYPTKVGEFVSAPHNREDGRSVIAEMQALGTSALSEIVKYCHANGMEAIWADRFNDCHDSVHTPEKPFMRWSSFKEAHPELLFGKVGERFPNGRWSAVDFGSEVIRERFVSFFREVAENYDIDGVQIDFFRHFYVFREVARGGRATSEQCALVVDMMRKLRKTLDEVGRRRGRPILIMVRVPDNFDYCKAVGLDMDAIVKEKLVDAVIGTGYFQLDTWRHWAELGRRYGIRTYASLSESRVKDQSGVFKRGVNLVMRGRAAAALANGVYGIHIFNQFGINGPNFKYVHEMADLDTFFRLNKLYIPVILDDNPNMYLKDGVQFRSLPIFTPQRPRQIDGEWTFNVETGEKACPQLVRLYVRGESATPFDVRLNGVAAVMRKSSDGVSCYEVAPSALQFTSNAVTLTGEGKLMDFALEVIHDAEAERVKF